MSPKTALVVSVIMHPSLMATYLCTVILLGGPAEAVAYDHKIKFLLIAVVFCLTFLLPAMLLLLLHRIKMITHLSLPERRDRLIPFVISITAYSGTALYFFTRLPQVTLLPTVMLVVAFTVLLTLLITIFYKISAHAIGVSGSTGTLVAIQQVFPDANFFYPLLAAIIIWGLTASARLALRAHTPNEILAGSGLGFLCCYTGIWVMV
ncbi:MAG: hypothetical protein RMJ44_01575 [Cytophagales bacterium]|nr:hypothetical protein [Bernardetiaceae bacterium]MDW8209751.1 hypothetical protein [Cytophagales bacterium]